MIKWVTLLALVVCVWQVSEGAAATNEFRVGVSLSLSGGTSRAALGQATMRGLIFFEEWYAAQADPPVINVGGVPHRLVFDVLDDESSLDLMLANYAALDGSSAAFIGPVNSDFSLPLRALYDGRKTMLLSSAAADACSIDSETFFSQLTPASFTFRSAFLQAKLAGALTYSYIAERTDYTQTACGSLPTIVGPESGMSLVCNYSVPTSLGAPGNASYDSWREAVLTLQRDCVQDVVVLCMYPVGGFTALDTMKQLNWLPNMVVVTPLLTAWDSNADTLFMSGNTQWYQGVQYPPDDYYGSSADFTAAFRQRWNVTPDSFDAFGAVAPLILLRAFANVPDAATATLSYYLSRVDSSSFYGRVLFGANHANLLDTVMVQYQPSGKNVVGPPRAQQTGLIYPMPNWDERAPSYGWYQYWGDYLVSVAAGLLILLSLALMAVTYVHRGSDVMKAAQVEFVMLFLAGSILCYLSVFCWLYYVTDGSCVALMWLLATGFTIMLSALFFKTARVHFIFNNPNLRSRRIPSWHIMAAIGACLALVWGLLIPWTAVDPLQQRIKQPDVYRPSLDYAVCAMGSTGEGFLIAILVIEGLLLVLGAVLAFLVRKVKLVLFNEAKWLGFSIYNLLILSAIAVGLLASDTGGPQSTFWIRTVIIEAACLIAVLCLMVPKLFFLKTGVDRKTTSNTSKSGTSANDTSYMHGTVSPSDEIALLREENARLKAKLAAVESISSS